MKLQSNVLRRTRPAVPANIGRKVVAHSVPPKQPSSLNGHYHQNVTRIDLSYATAVAEAKSATVLPQELWEKVTPPTRATHLVQLNVAPHHDSSPYHTAGYEAVDVASFSTLEEKVRVLSSCLRMQAAEPFQLFRNGPLQGPYKAHSKSLEDTLKLMISPRSTTLVLLDRRTKFVAGFAVMTEERRRGAASRLHAPVVSASCAHMFDVMLRAVHKYAASEQLELVTVLTDNEATHERHALRAHGLSVSAGSYATELPALPASPWAGCWED